VKYGVWHYLFDCTEIIARCTSYNQSRIVCDKTLCDCRYLLGSFTGPKYNFWQSLPRNSMMVNPGKSKVFERRATQ
jgi:hypothetical protein